MFLFGTVNSTFIPDKSFVVTRAINRMIAPVSLHPIPIPILPPSPHTPNHPHPTPTPVNTPFLLPLITWEVPCLVYVWRFMGKLNLKYVTSAPLTINYTKITTYCILSHNFHPFSVVLKFLSGDQSQILHDARNQFLNAHKIYMDLHNVLFVMRDTLEFMRNFWWSIKWYIPVQSITVECVTWISDIANCTCRPKHYTWELYWSNTTCLWLVPSQLLQIKTSYTSVGLSNHSITFSGRVHTIQLLVEWLLLRYVVNTTDPSRGTTCQRRCISDHVVIHSKVHALCFMCIKLYCVLYSYYL